MINHSSAMKNYTSSSIDNVRLILRVAVSAAARRCACCSIVSISVTTLSLIGIFICVLLHHLTTMLKLAGALLSVCGEKWAK